MSLMNLPGARAAADMRSGPPVQPAAKIGLAITLTLPLTTDFSFIHGITYARIISKDPVPVYHQPLDVDQGLPPVRTIDGYFMFVSLQQKDPLEFSNGLWYQINPDEYVQAEVLTYAHPSTFQGINVLAQPQQPFGWIIRNTPIFSQPLNAPTPTDLLGWPVAAKMAQPGQPFMPRYTLVTIYETSYLGDWGWYRIGPDQWVHLYDVGRVEVTPRPAGIPAGQHWIMVNLFDQTMAVYDEHDRMIYATLISSGRQLEGWQTPSGLYRIYKKVQLNDMKGGGKADRYHLEDVHANMYFYQGYAFHAAYWHDDFGRYKSHGCINMAPADAEWLYNWSTPVASPLASETKASDDNPGTWVWIYDPQE